MKDRVKIAVIDADENENLVKRLEIPEIPAVRYFVKSDGKKTDKDAKYYNANGMKTIMNLVAKITQSGDHLLELLTD